MASNHKLTDVLKGRAITSTQHQGSVLQIGLDDGSSMTVKTAGSTNSASTGGTIQAVRQAGTMLTLDFASGSSLEIATAEATSCVLVRDKAGKLEYAD